jgi:hypothetical protein
MTLSLKNFQPRSLLAVGPILLAFSVFCFIWVWWLEIQSERLFPGALHMPAFPYHQDMAFLVILASIGLLVNKSWTVALSVLFAGFALYVVLFRDFWIIASGGEVPFLSRLHFRYWWINFESWKILLSVLSSVSLCFSAARLAGLTGILRGDVEQIVGRERRERVSQLDSSGDA